MLQTSVFRYFVTILLVLLDLAVAKYSRTYRMPQPLLYCNDPVKEIDGALITHSYNKNSFSDGSSCILKFESDDDLFTTKRIYLNLTDIHISDCSNKLSVFFKDDTFGNPDYEFSCGSSTPGVVKSTSKFVSIRLNKQLKSPDKFSIVLTTVSNDFICSEFRCDNGRCIDEDLECDGVNHCFDGSDETKFGSTCSNEALVPLDVDVEKAVKVTLGVIVGIVIAIVVICVLCCVCIICCCCKKGYKGNVIQRPPQNTTTTTVPQTGAAQPAVQTGAYPQPPPQPAYPPPQQAPYPTGPTPYPAAPAPYPPSGQAPYPAAGYDAPPPYQDKPYSDTPPYPPTAYAGVQYTAAPDQPVVPSAPPSH